MNEQFDQSKKRGPIIQFGEMPSAPQKNLSKGYATASLALSILAFLAVFYACASLSYVIIVGFLLALLSIVMAVMAKKSHSAGKMPAAARVGLILSCVYLALLAVVLVIVLILSLFPNLITDLLNNYCLENFDITFDEFVRRVQSGSFTLPNG